MSENLHELCCSLIEEFYGDFHAQLFSYLAYYGRLSATQIAQKSHLPLKNVKAGLGSLVQHRLIYHHTTSEGLSTYQANTDSTYDLLRIGRLVQLVENEHGKTAGTIISEAFTLGFTTIAELQSKTLITITNSSPSLTNGEQHNEDPEAGLVKEIISTIQILIHQGYLHYLRSAHFQCTYDATHDIELQLKKRGDIGAAKTKKEKERMNLLIDMEFKRRLSTEETEHGYVPDASHNKKRPLDDDEEGPNSKRQKINGDSSAKVNGYSTPNLPASPQNAAVLLRVSFNNLVSYTRNISLAERAKKSLNGHYSNVLMRALSQVPNKKQYFDNIRDYVVDVRQLQVDVNHSERKNMSNGHQQNGATKVNGTHTYEDDEFDDGRMSYNEIDRALAVLADSEFTFLKGAYGKDWTVDKMEMDGMVRRHEISRMMNDRLQPPALRIVRMLIEKGKLDEKTLQEIGLLSAKDLRQTLANLKQMGYIDLQEVPRESQRQPNRTIYLWFHDSERVQRILLDSLYKAMTRLIERLKLERNKLSSTLEKTERSDVQGKETEMMSTAELRVLRRWERIEHWMLGEVSRLDESVALLRDL